MAASSSCSSWVSLPATLLCTVSQLYPTLLSPSATLLWPEVGRPLSSCTSALYCQATFPHPTFGATLHWSKVGRSLSSLCWPAVANWLPLPAHCQHIADILPAHCQHIGDIVGVRRHRYTGYMSWRGRKQTKNKSKEKTLSGRHDNL